MPELPEVQTLIDVLLESGICNKEIFNVEVFYPKILKNSSIDNFKKFLINENIINIERLGKYLIFKLSNNKTMIIHLRMEGKIFFQNINEKYDEKHTLLKIDFLDNSILYNDTRRFGTFHIIDSYDYLSLPELSKIALDPLSDNVDWKYFSNKFLKTKKHIKTALLDQTKISGIGNIYADEILFASKINPLKLANELSSDEWKKISKNSKLILARAVKNKGTTIYSYMFKNNAMGEFQKFLKVHTKKNMPCSECNAIIKKITINGRGSYFCPKCQL